MSARLADLTFVVDYSLLLPTRFLGGGSHGGGWRPDSEGEVGEVGVVGVAGLVGGVAGSEVGGVV